MCSESLFAHLGLWSPGPTGYFEAGTKTHSISQRSTSLSQTRVRSETKTLHRLRNRSPKWKGKEVSWKRRLESSRCPDGGGGSLRSCWFLVLFQPSIPNPSMWRRADRRAERPAITHRHLATRAWIKLNKKNNKRRSSNLKVQTVPEVSKSKVPRRLLIRGKLRLFVFVHKRERRRERKRGKPRTSRLS